MLAAGTIFMVEPESLPGVRAQLVAYSPRTAGWLTACTFPGEEAPGVIAVVIAEPWFDLGRWEVLRIDDPPDIPEPVAVVYRGGRQVLVGFQGNAIRPALEGELEFLGYQKSCSAARLVNACRAYLGQIEQTPDLEAMTAEAYCTTISLLELD